MTYGGGPPRPSPDKSAQNVGMLDDMNPYSPDKQARTHTRKVGGQ